MQKQIALPTLPEPALSLEPPTISTGTVNMQRRLLIGAKVALIVVMLGVAKAEIHRAGYEFLSLNQLFASAIGASIFIMGFLLSSIMRDYKEAERLPAEIRVALEAIHDDATEFARVQPQSVDLDRLRLILINITRALTHGLANKDPKAGFHRLLAHVDRLSAVFGSFDRLGMQPNFVTRLRVAQDSLRRSAFRIYHIQRTQFVPSVHVLVYSLVGLMLTLLLFLKTEGSIETALLFGVIAYLYIYTLYLIDLLEQPFRKGTGTLDDVSLFLLREFDEKVAGLLPAEPAPMQGIPQ